MKKVLIILIILAPVIALAQNGYLPGYVVTTEGDTLKGNIKKSKSKLMNGSIFKNDDTKLKLYPGKVRAFKIDRQIYVSEPVTSLKIKDDIKNNGNIFIRKRISGEVQLYTLDYCYGGKQGAKRENKIYSEKCVTLYFLKRKGQNYVEAWRKEKKIIGKVRQVKTTAQVADYFRDNEKLSEDILFERITREDIDIAVKRYNEWAKTQE